MNHAQVIERTEQLAPLIEDQVEKVITAYRTKNVEKQKTYLKQIFDMMKEIQTAVESCEDVWTLEELQVIANFVVMKTFVELTLGQPS